MDLLIDLLMETSDAARLLTKSAESVRYYERTGRLAAIKTTNGRRLFRKCDVEALKTQLETNLVESRAKLNEK